MQSTSCKERGFVTMNKIERAWQIYESAVDDYCEEQFEKYVKPYCIRNDFYFLAGNGTFYLSDWGKLVNTEGETLPDEEHPLFDVLCEEIPGMLQPVGSLMPDYRKEACDNENNPE
jgi:hypothetical protein